MENITSILKGIFWFMDPIFESLCVVQHLWKDLIFAKVYRVLRRPPEGFYGFASLVDAPDKNAYFQSSDYMEPDLDQTISFSLFRRRRFTASDTVGENEFKQSSIPLTQINQTICGIPENGPKGLRFRCWFYCSQEFWCLWHLLIHGPSYPIFKEMNYEQKGILTSLKPTTRSSLDILERWPAIFQAIALILVYREPDKTRNLELPEDFLASCLNLYKTLM